jgi:hypothetical protein
MPGIFDRLQKQLEVRKREQGISALEIRDLPANLRKVMRLMLREVVMKYADLVAAVEAMPEDKQRGDRLSRAELDSALATLVEQNWLLCFGEGEFVSYRVNLRRKAGIQDSGDVWAALNARIAAGKTANDPDHKTSNND